MITPRLFGILTGSAIQSGEPLRPQFYFVSIPDVYRERTPYF